MLNVISQLSKPARMAICVLLAGIAMMITPGDVTSAQRAMIGIFMLSAGLWVSEAIPLHITSLLVMGLQVLLFAVPGHFLAIEGATPQKIFGALGNPIIILFLGGFILARVAEKYFVDELFARKVLAFFGDRPSMVLLGIMVITAFISMWVSNTATTALMLTMVLPLLKGLDKTDPLRKAMILAIPFSANIGGIGTPIGSPPNAVALAALQKIGMRVTFIDWMQLAVPLLVLLLLATWLLLARMFPAQTERFRPEWKNVHPLKRDGLIVLCVTLITMALWISGSWHSLPESVTALIPVVIFGSLGYVSRHDINALEWTSLILIAGGIALGDAMRMTGLNDWALRIIPMDQLGPMALLALFAAIMVALASVMSHTAATNLLAPILAGVTVIHPVLSCITVAIIAGVTMPLPVSTPPNAMGYATGEISSRDMFRTGGLVTILSTILIVLTAGMVFRFWELIPGH